MLSERQQRAEALCQELRKLGAEVINPLPLDDNSKLKFQMLDSDKDRIITEICSWGWTPQYVQAHPRFSYAGLIPGSLYEIDLPRPRVSVSDDIKGEFAEDKATREQRRREAERYLKHAGLMK